MLFCFIHFLFQEESKSNYIELDLDEVLDIEEDKERKHFILVSICIRNCI